MTRFPTGAWGTTGPGTAWFPGPLLAQPPLADIARTGEMIARLVRRFTTSALLIGFSQGMAAAITTMRRYPDLLKWPGRVIPAGDRRPS